MGRSRSVLRRVSLGMGVCVLAGCTPSAPSDSYPKPTVDASVDEPKPTRDAGPGSIPSLGVDARVFDPGEGGVSASRLQRSKVDLLVMLDDSSSMVEKHALLKAAVPDLVRRLVNPVCMAVTGGTSQHASPKDPCP